MKTYKFSKEYEDIKNTKIIVGFILECSGNIYGGYVRDYILRKYNTELFTEKYGKRNPNFRDSSFDHKTQDRLLLSKDIDVQYYNINDLNRTLEYVKSCGFSIIHLKESNIYAKIISNVQQGNNDLENRGTNKELDKFEFKKYRISKKVQLGPIKYDYNIYLDCVISGHMDPPFGVCDFISNILIMNYNCICISKYTGIYKIDSIDRIEDIKILSFIIDLIEKKQNIYLQPYLKNITSYDINRLLKMLSKEFDIINFENIVEYNVENNDNMCMICYHKPKVVFEKFNYFCNECLMKSIEFDNNVTGKEIRIKTQHREYKNVLFKPINDVLKY